MLSALLPALRNLRVSLLTGGLIIGSLYIFFGHALLGRLALRQEAIEIGKLAPFMPFLLLATLCLLVGSLYMTSLEGLVDWLHRVRLFTSVDGTASYVSKEVYLALEPYSPSARRRIERESGRFFDSYKYFMAGSSVDLQKAKEDFTRRVLSELLWLEGKLVGTALEVTYDQYRSEGELRLGTALLLPIAVAATAYGVGFGRTGIIIATVVAFLLAVPLASYGLYYFRRAHSFLAHHVADGTILAPAMEELRRAYAPKVVSAPGGSKVKT